MLSVGGRSMIDSHSQATCSKPIMLSPGDRALRVLCHRNSPRSWRVSAFQSALCVCWLPQWLPVPHSFNVCIFISFSLQIALCSILPLPGLDTSLE